MARWAGEYSIIEGTDATGKTTVANLLALRAYDEGHEVIRVDEPDSPYRFDPNIEHPKALAPISSEIRKVIKNGDLGRQAITNLYLFTAARAESWHSIVLPALERGARVIGARNFYSSVIYQGEAEGLDKSFIEQVTLEAMGAEYMNPDHLDFLDISDENERARRIAQRGTLESPDTFESRDASFQQSLIDGYRLIAEERNIKVWSAARPKDDITDDIWNRTQQTISERTLT